MSHNHSAFFQLLRSLPLHPFLLFYPSLPSSFPLPSPFSLSPLFSLSFLLAFTLVSKHFKRL